MSKTISCFLLLSLVVGCLAVENIKNTTALNESTQKKCLFKQQAEIDVNLKYLLYLPTDYNDSNQPWPLIVFLHGKGQRSENLDTVKTEGLPKWLEDRKEFPFVVISPLCPTEDYWIDHIEGIKALIDSAKQKYNIDCRRVYLTGLSMGGFGSWWLAEKYPNDFAAIAPICGGGEPFLAYRLKMPVWVFHGAKDKTVPIRRSQEMVDKIKAAGGNVKFTIYPELGHNCWDESYRNEELYEWFLKYKRQNND